MYKICQLSMTLYNILTWLKSILLDVTYLGGNMQPDPLLENLDQVFTSLSWAASYPDTSVKVLGRPVSDHVPFVIDIGTSIPRSFVFRFENYWVEFIDFLATVNLHWRSSPCFGNPAKTLASKFKQVRAGLKKWSKQSSNLSRLISNGSYVLTLLDGLRTRYLCLGWKVDSEYK